MSTPTTVFSPLQIDEVREELAAKLSVPVRTFFEPGSRILAVDGSVGETTARLHAVTRWKPLHNPLAPVMRVHFEERDDGTSLTYHFALSAAVLAVVAAAAVLLGAVGFATAQGGIGSYTALALGSSLVMACTVAYVFGAQQKHDLARFLCGVTSARAPSASGEAEPSAESDESKPESDTEDSEVTAT